MTAQQAIKLDIMLGLRVEFPQRIPDGLSTGESIDNAWIACWDCEVGDVIDDAVEEFRNSYVCETNISTDYSRHYESNAVARQLHDGRWVGWTFWYGGGKHGEPSGIPWMEDAYFLDVAEEERLVVVRTFKKKEITG